MTIALYTKPGCPSCENLKSYLRSHGYVFEEFVLGVDVTKEQLLEMFPGATTVPQVLIDGAKAGGYEATVQFLAEYIPNDNREMII